MNRDEIRKSYEKNGFHVFRDVLDKATIGQMNIHVDWLLETYDVPSPEHLHHTLMRDDAFWLKIVSDDRLLDIARMFLGADLVCFTAHYICKPPRTGVPVYWHQDGAYWNIKPMEAITLWIAVDKSTKENGCLYYIPGSHKNDLLPKKKDRRESNMLASRIPTAYFDPADGIPVELEPGDVSVHHSSLIHCSHKNTSSLRRCGLDIGYTSTKTKLGDTGLYQSPFLLTPSAITDPERYSPWPTFDKNKTIFFDGVAEWDETAEKMNRSYGFLPRRRPQESVINTTKRMLRRLLENSTEVETNNFT